MMQENQLLVGYGKAAITPTESVPLRGYGSTEKRMSTAIRSDLYQIAIAITDGQGNTGIIIASDTCGIDDITANDIRKGIQEKFGVPASNVLVCALHQHSAPDLRNDKVPSSARYREEIYIPGAIAAAGLALENRAGATVKTASVKTENMNFVRHYVMEDDSIAGPNFGKIKLLEPKAHVSQPDNEMVLVKFCRKGQKTMDGKTAKDIILTNYQGHLLMGTSATNTEVHNDLVGIYRDALEAELDCQAVYISGASGNLMFKSMIKELNRTEDYVQHGKTLAAYAIAAEESYVDVQADDLRIENLVYTGNCNHGEDYMLEKAQAVWAQYCNEGDVNIFRENGFESMYHCSLLISHARLPQTKEVELFLLSLGQVAFVGVPFEMFCQTGMDIKAESPFKTTAIFSIANGYNGYLPTNQAWEYYCYERHNSVFEKGTCDELKAVILTALKEI